MTELWLTIDNGHIQVCSWKEAETKCSMLQTNASFSLSWYAGHRLIKCGEKFFLKANSLSFCKRKTMFLKLLIFWWRHSRLARAHLGPHVKYHSRTWHTFPSHQNVSDLGVSVWTSAFHPGTPTPINHNCVLPYDVIIDNSNK